MDALDWYYIMVTQSDQTAGTPEHDEARRTYSDVEFVMDDAHELMRLADDGCPHHD